MNLALRLAAVALSLGSSCLLACSPGVSGRSAWRGDRTLTESGELVRVMQTIRKIDFAWQRQQVGRVGREMTDDVVLLPPGEPKLVGREEALRWLREWSRPFVLRDTRTTQSVSVEGPFAIEVWTIDRLSTRRRDGRERRSRLKGISIYRRGDNGIYLLSHRIWNESPLPSGGVDLR